ncbi:hypothetical protein F5Y01DRAFT_193722 [Xylaria sp. FL0043]|nr:hypothetical protein F5Y01DRAFT_193722 [Xylaria sp. FL0043]
MRFFNTCTLLLINIDLSYLLLYAMLFLSRPLDRWLALHANNVRSHIHIYVHTYVHIMPSLLSLTYPLTYPFSRGITPFILLSSLPAMLPLVSLRW